MKATDRLTSRRGGLAVAAGLALAAGLLLPIGANGDGDTEGVARDRKAEQPGAYPGQPAARQDGNHHGDHQPSTVNAHALLAYPMETARDWVSFGDHVAVVHMRSGSEEAGKVPADVRRRGEGRVSRTGRLVVDQVLHSRAGAQPLPSDFRTLLSGWWWDGDTGRQEFNLRGTSRIEGGHSYIAVLVLDRESGRFEVEPYGGVLPFDRGVVGQGEIEGSSARGVLPAASLTGMAKQANGQGLAAVTAALKQAALYPAAAAHPDLPAEQRYHKVLEAAERPTD